MKLKDYLKGASEYTENSSWLEWRTILEGRLRENSTLYESLSTYEKNRTAAEFQNRIRTEELKAWYGSPEGESIFQGTSISSLTIRASYNNPLKLDDISSLEIQIAKRYIQEHDRLRKCVKDAIIEDTQEWIKKGLFYGVCIASKVLSQAFALHANVSDIVFKVDNYLVDPHEITSYPDEVRQKYFEKVLKRVECFEGLEIDRQSLESSLILADISKPKLEKYNKKILLAPVCCNQIAEILSKRVRDKIEKLSEGRINPPSLSVTICDTDAPYTYNHLLGCGGQLEAPELPGLTVLGCSGTISAFRWLYSYRVSLISQKIMKSSLYSEVHRDFIPFVFFGVLVPRDADILLDMKNLSTLRYKGNLSPQIEYLFLVSDLLDYVNSGHSESLNSLLLKHI